MKQTGIIMSGDHPRKVLDGTKTQTRRVIVPQPELTAEFENTSTFRWKGLSITKEALISVCPYGQVGDRLWVRETFCEHTTGGVIYRADEEPCEGVYSYHKWKPSIFMPRWASRITLEITEVRVERLQEISDEDAIAEGIERHTDSGNNIFWFEVASDYHGSTQSVTAIEAFGKLWDSLNAKRGYPWSGNWWVWVISFKPC